MEHEYAVIGGLNRAEVGRYLSIAASFIAAFLIHFVPWLFELAKYFGLANHIPGLVLWPITAGLIYTVLYWLFESYIWKWPLLRRLHKVPDISGTWRCTGHTIKNPNEEAWVGRIKIVQSWDKLRVRLMTDKSGSSSIAAALVCDKADGFRLLYNYGNDPNIAASEELSSHRGSAELTFSPDLTTATGEYFNGYGRNTFGTMTLIREVTDGA